MEIAQYSVKPSVRRIVIPQILKLAGLCALFYLGVWANLWLLGYEMPSWIGIVVISVLVLLAVVQVLITNKKAQDWRYSFYSNRIEYEGDRIVSVLFSEVEDVKVKRNVFDLFAGTATIVLSKKFKLKSIPNYKPVADYAYKLTQAFKAQQTAYPQATY